MSSMKVEIEKIPFDKLEKNLKKLPNTVQRNVMRKGMRRFLSVIRKAAKENAPVKSGRLKKSITSKVSLRRDGNITGRVFVSPKKHRVYYGHFAEWGRHSKPQKATRFMSRAFEQYSDPDLFSAFVMAAFQEEMKKLKL
tara:strand:+ start:479 stop:895 length:417 start_codon:yes stop_codon:yes gene_type:complete